MTIGKYLRLLAAILIVACLASWPAYNLYQDHTNYRESRFLFDTEVFIEAHGWGAKEAALDAFAIMSAIHQKLDKFSSESDIYTINLNAGDQPVPVADPTYEILEQSLKIAEMTGGAFDPTIGPLVKLWGFGEGSPQSIPSVAEINAARQLVDYKKVILDREKKTVYLAEKGMSLDLGAIAKGYAVAKSVEILKSHHISSALVAAGGNIYALGKKKDKSSWQIGIRDPLKKGEIIGYVGLENQVIDTSGDYERFFLADGKKYGHIIDPRTGYPAQAISGCTVIMDNPAQADALATAAFVLGAEKGLELIESQKGMGLLINSQGQVFLSKEMKELLHI